GFTGVVDKLHGDRLILGWADVKRATSEITKSLDLIPDLGLLDYSKAANELAVDLHAESKAIVFQGGASGGGPGGGSPEPARSLPASTFAALSLFDVGAGIADAIKRFTGAAGSDVLDDVQRETGIDLQADVLAWMGKEVVVAAAPAPAGPIPGIAV